MLVSMFFVALIAATIWPSASEVLFVAYLLKTENEWVLLLMVATIGNSLGSIVMFEFARVAHIWLSKRTDKMKQRISTWQIRLGKHGPILLFFAWVPIIGDILPLAAGILKLPRILVYFWLTMGKLFRYGLIICLTLLI